MMVAVENMAMPDRCLECRFCQEFSCVAADVSKVPNSSVPLDRKKPEWCPLRKVDTAAAMTSYSRNDARACKKIAQESASEAIFNLLKSEKVITFSDYDPPTKEEKLYVKAQLSVVFPRDWKKASEETKDE